MEATQQSENTKVTQTSSAPRGKLAKPDGGLAWVVAIAACVINLIMAGLGRMSGILFVAFIEIFGVDRQSASMPFSVRSSARNLFGPVVGILGQKYGSRKVIIVGSIIGTLSSAACFFAPDILWITLLWGGLSGLGSALTVTLPQVVIGQYFVKYRTTAVGIAFSGGCVGSFLFPALLEYLLQNFGIEGTFLIMGAIIMHTIPAALILKKPPWLKNEQKSPNDSHVDKMEEGNESVTSCNTEAPPKMDYLSTDRMSVTSVNECVPKRSSLRVSGENVETYPDVGYLKQNRELVLKLIGLKISGKDITVSEAHDDSSINTLNEIIYLCESRRSEQISLFQQNIKFSGDDVFDTKDDSDVSKIHADNRRKCKSCQLKSVHKIFRAKSDSSLPLLNESFSSNCAQSKVTQLLDIKKQTIAELFPGEENKVIRILTEFQLLNIKRPKIQEVPAKNHIPKNADEQNKLKVDDTVSNSFSHHIKTAISLYSNPLFLMVCLCRAVHFITFIPAMTTVVDFTMDKGLHEDDGKYSIAAISMGDLLGRLCLGWITDRGCMTLPKYMMVFMVVQGFSTASLPMMNTKVSIFVNLALFGMLQGSLFVRHPVLIAKYMKDNEQSIAMGCVNFLSGILGFGLPLYIGYFRDSVGSYDYIFYLNGMLGTCVGFLWVFEPFFVRMVNSSRTTQKIEVV